MLPPLASGQLLRAVPLAIIVSFGLASSAASDAAGAAPSAADLVRQILHSDPWGLGAGEVSARVTIRDKSGRTRELAFTARSRRHDPPLTKSLVRFTEPADIAGVGFLQIQAADEDDDRWLYLPDLRRSRRIAGKTRKSAFMGTDFSYADLDRRDLRRSAATLVGTEDIDGTSCWRLEAVPEAKDAPYGKLEIWIARDTLVPLRWQMYAPSGVLVKTLTAEEVREIDGRWFVTRSLMENHADSRTTTLVLEKVRPTGAVPDDEFTLRNLERY